MKRFFLASACAAVLAFSVAAPPALATVRTMTVKNDSTSCAWITIYEAAHTFLPWQIVHSTYGHPRFIKPGNGWSFLIDHPLPTDVKVRAEVKAHSDCSGHNIADISDYRKDVTEGLAQMRATLSKPHGHYTLSIH